MLSLMYCAPDFSVVCEVRQKAHAFTPSKRKTQIILICGLFSFSTWPLGHFQLHRSYNNRYFGGMHDKEEVQKELV